MTVHVLHAGDGYTYLTRQVATGDQTRARGESLSDYYVADGNPPGRWVGEGLVGLGVSGQVTEEQMKALFGEGRHPDADARERALVAGGIGAVEAMKATQLGRRFPQFAAVDDAYPQALSAAFAQFRADHDRAPEVGVERDLIRWNVARSLLAKTSGGAPTEASVARFLAARGAAQRQPVAGYDLVFTPVKSVSTLWGLGDERVRRQVEQAHESAWRATLAWIESEAALTRVGAGGVAQINTKGLVATAFDHLDSRTGDPNLHTHLAVANKVQGSDGKWRSLDGRVLHLLGVAASERYNTRVESELVERLGVRFVDEVRTRGARPVREVEGIDAGVRQGFSSRRAAIEDTYDELVGAYRAQHGHEPARAAQFRFAQQATLATRTAKEEGVTFTRRRAQWRQKASRVLGSEVAVDDMIAGAIARPTPEPDPQETPKFEDLVSVVLGNIAQARAVWGVGHVHAEAQRVARAHAGALGIGACELADELTAQVMRRSLPLSPPDLNPAPVALRRSDGELVYQVHGAGKFTSIAVLEAEDRLVTAARTTGGLTLIAADVDAAIDGLQAAGGRGLNDGQRALARRFAAGGHLVEAGIGPAGAGKTTAMTAFARAVEGAGGRVIGLAPSASAASVLGDELGIGADTIHKLLDAHDRGLVPERLVVDARTILLVDEAGMASTPDLDRVLSLARQHGASVRLLGDPAQLAAVGAGGVLRLIDNQVGAAHLEQVHRFVTPGEAQASLLLREGDKDGLDFYVDAARTTGGTREAMTEDVYAGWWNDMATGKNAVMIAATNEDVVRLGARARLDRVTAGAVEAGGVGLHDGSRAGVGDVIVTRRNDRQQGVGRGTDFVKNGDLWHVTERDDNGSLRVRNLAHGGFVTLPADYVAEHVELGYAATIHRVQGMTTATAHYLVDAGASREQLYTGVTRGRESNRLYVVVDELIDVDLHAQPAPARAVREALERVLARADLTPSATDTLNDEYERAESLARLVPQYQDAAVRILDPRRDDRLGGVVRAGLPAGLAEAVLDDEAWPALRDRLAAHEHTGADVADVLRAAAGGRELDTAGSLAQVLHYRVGEPGAGEGADAGASRSRLPGWIAREVPGETGSQDDAGGRAWLARHVQRIQQRLDELVTAVEVTAPAWARDLAPVPTDPQAAQTWRANMRRVVAYRDTFTITATDAVPDTSVRGLQEDARTDAARAAASLRTRTPASGKNPDRVEVIARLRERMATANRVQDATRRMGADQEHEQPTAAERLRKLREQREQQQRAAPTRPLEPGPERRGPHL